ncbi:variant-silencing SET domain-containing protein-like [Melanaphis sacchari]|uniref:variant-silencing SET domain-containing protein-like n=1 Tax=Melanaphis sacchari TaxID=742174 RepID=UPI000DC1563E|nr:variant-silencing SET domain-containing protein-like [Melanaphis sacchari]
MNEITMPKICADKFTKTSPLSINTTIKHAEKVDYTSNPSKSSSSDSESSVGMNEITMPKICADKFIKTSPSSINTTIKHAEKVDYTSNPSKSSSSDSESSTGMNEITTPKICVDKFTKTSPLSINTVIKHAEKVDHTESLSNVSLSDSESSVEMITSSKICDDESTNKSSEKTNTIIKHDDNSDSSSELSSSDSEFSSKIKIMLSNFKENNKNKSRTSLHIHNSVNNNKHIESPLFSSTPILNSEHSVNSINLIRNKQLEQLKKHLIKNSSKKQKSLDSIKVPHQFSKDKLSQSLNIIKNTKNNDNNDNQPKVIANLVNSNEKSGSANKINYNNSRQGDSDTSKSELGQKNISVNNSFLKKPEKSIKIIKKHKQSNKIGNAILNSINTNKMKFNANITNNLIDSNNEYSKDSKEENTVYTQQKHDLNKEILNCKNSNEEAIKNSLTLSLSTKNIKKKDIVQKKDTNDCKNQINNKIFKESLNTTLSIISDSDSNCSSDLKLPTKDLSHTTDFNEKIENETSSSDDEIYSKLRQNISKTQINTNHLNEKPKSQSLPTNKMCYSTDESDSSSKFFCNTSKLSSNLIKPNITKQNSINVSETDSCKKSSNNNLLSNENILKKDKKKKKVNVKSVFSPNKMDIIKHILDESSSSNNEVTALKNKTNDKKQVNEKKSTKKSTLNVSKLNKNNEVLNKEISNPFLKVYSTNVTSSSSDDELDISLMKPKRKSSGNKNIPLVNEEKKKNILINQVLTSMKRKNKKQKLSVSQTNLNASVSNNKHLKNDKITKDKTLLGSKNKKDVLDNFNISTERPKLNVSSLNIYQKVNSSQLNTQLSSDENTDNEEDVIKKILEKRKFKKAKKANSLEQTMKSNTQTELNEKKQSEVQEKLYTKSKSQKMSMTDEIKSNDMKKKKKKKRETKDMLLDSIISAFDDSLSDQPPSKKRKKDHNLTIESYDYNDKNSDGNLSEVKIKKKKKSKHKEDVNLSDLTVKDKKKQHSLLLESVSKNNLANEDNTIVKVTKKKKVKNNPVVSETQSIITHKHSEIDDKLEDKNVKNIKLNKKKTNELLESQMKSFMLTQDNSHLDNLYNLLSVHLNNS